MYGKKRRKRCFHGNQFTKKEKKTSETNSSVVTDFDNADAVDNVAGAEDMILHSVTPTCSEKKLYNLL